MATEIPLKFPTIDSWLETKSLEGRTERTLDAYRASAERLACHLKRDPWDATTQEVRSFLASIQSSCSNVTVNNNRRNLNSYYAYLEDEDIIAKSPMRKVHYVKEERTVKRPFTDEDLVKLIDATRTPRERAMVAFLASTGCRVGELVGVMTADVDLEEREAKVYGKGRKERMAYFDSRCALALREYLATRSDQDPHLFVSEVGRRHGLTTGCVESIVRNIGRAAGVDDVHPHRFRRTVATRAIDRGMPIEQVKELLGHSQIQTTMIYATVSAQNVKASHRRYLT